MPFGKWEGHEVRDIPIDYLRWLAKQSDLYGALKVEVMEVLREQTAIADEWLRLMRERYGSDLELITVIHDGYVMLRELLER